MASHKVPTHLQTPDGMGPFAYRQIILGAGAFAAGAKVWDATKGLGPSLGDLISAHYPGIESIFQAGSLPAGTLALSSLVAAPFVAAALPFNPPAEHGAFAATSWARKHGLWPVADVESFLGGVKVVGDVFESEHGIHAAWELPSVNLRLADAAGVEVAQDLWGQFLMGLEGGRVMTMTRAARVDSELLVQRIADYPRAQARDLASWLRAQVVTRNLIERRHYLAIVAEDEPSFEDLLAQVEEGLGNLGFRDDTIRRLQGDEAVQRVRGAWDVGRSQVRADGVSHEVIALGKWPRKMTDNWLAPFIDGRFAIDVVQHIQPIDPDSILGDLERTLNAMKASRPNRKRRKAIEDLESFVDALEGDEQRAFDVAIYFHVHDKDRKVVAAEGKRLRRRIRSAGARGATLPWEQAAALKSVSLLASDALPGRTRRVDTGSVIRAYPWSASAMWPEGAVPWGETLESKRTVGWTPWRRPIIANPHLIIYSVSGGGKGFGWKVVSSRLLFAGETHELFAFDQAEEDEEQGEYGRWAEYCGLEYRHVHSLDLDMRAVLRDIASGNVGAGVVWNIARLPLADRPEFLYETKSALFARAIARQARRQWAIDELWSFLVGAEQMGADPRIVALCNGAIEDVIRRGRHVKLGGAFMTQRVLDSLKSTVMQVISSQASSQWYGMQHPSDVTTIAPVLHWTAAEVAAVKRFAPGRGLLVAGPWRVTMRVTASDQEFEMANTDGRVDHESVRPGRDDEDDHDDAGPERDSGDLGGSVVPLAVPEVEWAEAAD